MLLGKFWPLTEDGPLMATFDGLQGQLAHGPRYVAP